MRGDRPWRGHLIPTIRPNMPSAARHATAIQKPRGSLRLLISPPAFSGMAPLNTPSSAPSRKTQPANMDITETVIGVPNDKAERRGASPASNEGILSQSSTPSFSHRKTRPRESSSTASAEFPLRRHAQMRFQQFPAPNLRGMLQQACLDCVALIPTGLDHVVNDIAKGARLAVRFIL